MRESPRADCSPTKMIKIFYLLATLCLVQTEYIPDGPAYPCPKQTDNSLLYPCVCEKGSDAGLYIRCENSGLATLSVGIGNIAGLGTPVERLSLKECKISNLFGPLFHRSSIRVLHIEDSPIKTISQYAFAGVNRTLQELYMVNTKIEEFPKEAFKILGNLTILSIDGHAMTKLSKDIFAGSEAAGRLEKLHLVNGMINDIAAETFQNLKKLKTLDLHGNRLANLKRSQFKGLRDTEVLDISFNNITKLDGSHIGDLTKLGWCNASHNLIADMPRGMFARNTILKVLHLNGNKLKKLDVNSFRGMRFLRRLFLQDNQISDIGRETFSGVTRIGTVDLARNRIRKVDYQMFQSVKYAELINLAENNITIIEKQAFTELYLATVNVSHNQLTAIEGGAFVNCNNMTVLDLSHNQLETIAKTAFDENSYAGELIVSYNEFKDFSEIPILHMTGIRVLNASYNKITTIPKNSFPKLYELHTVDISHNNLTDIANAVFQNLFSLRLLNLSHNEMEVIKIATFGTVPTILELDLSHNKLREISKGSLAKLASCRSLDVSFNMLERIFQIPISLGELNLSHNNLTEINANTWPTMNALLRLNLSHNHLEDRLTRDSFAGLLTVQVLDLSENGVTKPPWEALNTFTSLQYLYLQRNSLTSLTRSAFGNLPTLFKLDLSNNQISSVEQRSFQGLQQLLDLSLSRNLLDHIPNEAFKTLVSLRILDLSYNSLEKIDNKTHGLLDDCLSLETVSLSHNRIGFLSKKMFPYSPWIPYRLSSIDLSYNEIPVLTFDLTVGTQKLERLNLQGNIITDIRNNVLGNLTLLKYLDLSNNKLKDLISRTSDLKFNLPSNITELHLENNSLQSLPIKQLMNATRLSLLDVRNNQLTSFDPELVKKVKEGLTVLFEGNTLNCDCFVRPLKHLIARLPPHAIPLSPYPQLTCSDPPSLSNETLLAVIEERLLCASNVEFEDKKKTYGDFELESEPDLTFRDVQYSQPQIYANWYVRSTDDIADFYLYIRNANNKYLYTNDISYNLRSLTVTLEDNLKNELKSGSHLEICIQAKNSKNFARRWYKSQCQNLPGDFDSWPKKLTVDKRRLTKKKKVTYSWFGNSALGLISDSILITLCIFLGACFRRLSDVELI